MRPSASAAVCTLGGFVDDARAKRKAGWRLMREAVRAHRRMMYLGIFAGLLWAVARVAVPWLAGRAVDHGVAQEDWTSARNWMFLILAVGAVQAVCTGIRRTPPRARVKNGTNLRMRLRIAHLKPARRVPTGPNRSARNLRQHRRQRINNTVPLSRSRLRARRWCAVAVILLLEPRTGVLALAALPCSTSRPRFQPQDVPRRSGPAGALGLWGL
jgi:MFS family permease